MFKTPQTGIITTGEPETKFVKRMIEENTVKAIDSFVKSSDTGFYCFDYTWQKGSHHQIGQFNPDFFIKKKDIVIVVEIKDDSQISNPDIENLGKYRAANSHFQRINAYFEREIVNILEITERSCLVENSIEGILNQSWSCVPSEIFIRLHWERPL